MNLPSDRTLRPTKDPMPCTVEEPCKVCGGMQHPCYTRGVEVWCGFSNTSEAEAIQFTPTGYEFFGTAPSGQAVYLPIPDLKIRERRLDPTPTAFDPDSFVDVMAEVDRILAIESEAQQDWEGMKLARRIKGSNWGKLKAIHLKHKDESKQGQWVGVQTFLTEQTEDREWLIAGHLSAGTTAVLFADGGVGKTLLAYDLCKAIASGQPWNGFKTKQGKVMIVQTDEPRIDMRERLTTAGFEEFTDDQVVVTTDWQFSRMKELRAKVEKERPLFVVIDSFTSANRAAEAGSEWDATYGTPLYGLRDIADTYGCSFLVLHHENKAGGARGTTAIRNNVSEVWRLRKGEKPENLKPTQRVLEIEKSRSGCNAIYQIELNPDDNSWLHQGEFGVDETASTPLKARILNYLELNPEIPFEVEELVNVASLGGSTKDSLRMQLERLRKAGHIKSEFRTTETGTHGGRRRYRVYFVQSKTEGCSSSLFNQDENVLNPGTAREILIEHLTEQSLDVQPNGINLIEQTRSVQSTFNQDDLGTAREILIEQKKSSPPNLKLSQVVQSKLEVGDQCTYIGTDKHLRESLNTILTLHQIEGDYAVVKKAGSSTIYRVPLKDLEKV